MDIQSATDLENHSGGETPVTPGEGTNSSTYIFR